MYDYVISYVNKNFIAFTNNDYNILFKNVQQHLFAFNLLNF